MGQGSGGDDGYFSTIRNISNSAVVPFILLFTGVAVGVLILLLARKAVIFTPEKLKPKMARISVLKTAKSKFGPSGLFEFLKSFVKLVVFAVVLGVVLAIRFEEILSSLHRSSGHVVLLVLQQITFVLAISAAIALAIGVADDLWQKQHFLKTHRMSRQDLKDEMKRSEGDPEQKAERKRRAREVSQNRMLLDVPGSDVVIVNPTHFAVALQWDRQTKGAAPKCVAKGQDHVATTIREIAMKNGIPVFSDPPTARALHATVEIGQQIQFDHYAAVAAAIRYADGLNASARKLRT
jgi:flagellar biosynthetic protein FlhB